MKISLLLNISVGLIIISVTILVYTIAHRYEFLKGEPGWLWIFTCIELLLIRFTFISYIANKYIESKLKKRGLEYMDNKVWFASKSLESSADLEDYMGFCIINIKGGAFIFCSINVFLILQFIADNGNFDKVYNIAIFLISIFVIIGSYFIARRKTRMN